MFNLCRQTQKTNQADRRLPSISCFRDEWSQGYGTIVPRRGLLSCSHFANEETEIQRGLGRARAGSQIGRIKTRWSQISLAGDPPLCTWGTFLQVFTTHRDTKPKTVPGRYLASSWPCTACCGLWGGRGGLGLYSLPSVRGPGSFRLVPSLPSLRSSGRRVVGGQSRVGPRLLTRTLSYSLASCKVVWEMMSGGLSGLGRWRVAW